MANSFRACSGRLNDLRFLITNYLLSVNFSTVFMSKKNIKMKDLLYSNICSPYVASVLTVQCILLGNNLTPPLLFINVHQCYANLNIFHIPILFDIFSNIAVELFIRVLYYNCIFYCIIIVQAFVNCIKAELEKFPAEVRDSVVILFSAHSLPMKVYNNCRALFSNV